MEIECPECKKDQELDEGDCPSNACDSKEYECKYCEHVFHIGWYATAEVRKS